MLVVDASVLATALAEDGADGRRARARLSGQVAFAPAVIDLEVASFLRKAVRGGLVTAERARRALTDLDDSSLQRSPHPPMLGRIWELRDNVTAYDAAYVALAEMLDVPLLTADGKLARATGTRCAFELLQ